VNFVGLVRDNPYKSMPLSGPRQIGTSSLRLSTSDGCRHQPWRNTIIKIMVLLHSADGLDWQLPPKGTSVKTLYEAEEQGFITMRGEFQKRQFRLTALGAEHVERDRRRLEARKR
jgi:hypothetical protein